MDSLMQIRRKIIASQPHIVTVSSATIANFSTDVSANIKRLNVTFVPSQSGSGDPSPSNIRVISGMNSIIVTIADASLIGQTITAALGDTFYGGQLDFVSGKLIIDTACITLTGDNIGGTFYTNRSGTSIRFTTSHKGPAGDYGAGKTTVIAASNVSALPNGTSSSPSKLPGIAYAETNNVPWIALPTSYNVTDIATAKTWLENNPVQFAYKRKTPLTYQLNPQTIKTLRGINNIWSDQGTVEVKYWTH